MKQFVYICLAVGGLLPLSVQGQVFTPKVKTYVREGNKAYEEKSYVDAEVSYKKALEEEEENFAARFNLGNTHYQRKNYDKAIEEYKKASVMAGEPSDQALAYHNLGNSFLEKKDYKKAISAFKDALKRNPNDADTRYNLAYA